MTPLSQKKQLGKQTHTTKHHMQRQWKIWVWNMSWVDVSMYFQKGQEEDNPTGRGLHLGPFPEMEWTNTQVRVVKLAVRSKWGKQIVSELLLHSFANFSPSMLPCPQRGPISSLKKIHICANVSIISKILWHARSLGCILVKLRTGELLGKQCGLSWLLTFEEVNDIAVVVNGETCHDHSSSNLVWMAPLDGGESCPGNYFVSPLSRHPYGKIM